MRQFVSKCDACDFTETVDVDMIGIGEALERLRVKVSIHGGVSDHNAVINLDLCETCKEELVGKIKALIDDITGKTPEYKEVDLT